MNAPRRGTPDFPLLFLTLILVAFGLIMVFSSSSVSASYHHGGDSLHFTKRQILAIVLGIIGMIISMNIHHTLLKKLAVPTFLIILTSLVLVLLIGVERNQARSWFAIGPLQLQPAELAKIGIIIYLSALITKKGERFRDFKTGMLPALIIIAITVGLILLQPDFGTAMILGMGAVLLLVIGGANLKHLGLLAGSGAAAAGLVLLIMFRINPNFGGFRIARITTFMDPWADELGDGFHIIQSLYAFGHGGLTGAGFGQSIQKLHFLPAPHNDFIFAIIAEELGFIGATIFLLVYLMFIVRGLIVSLRAKDHFAKLVGVGIMGSIAIQALINLGGVTNSIPLTGITLPLISYGGTSVMVTLTSLGIVLGLSREYNRIAEQQSSAATGNRNIRRERAVNR